ncbi:MAG: HAMP domain-containing histidine kinase [Myxococcales bacterium]|nr:HAMP domain-containing histidine kinase [Myxococcales bacterium]
MSGRRSGSRRRGSPGRTALAAVVVLGIVGSLLLGWYVAGAADARTRAAAARQRPLQELRAQTEAIADELRRDLDEVLRRESQRPYYHYSNLFRDPRSTSAGLSLSPSPLASGPSEPLVAEHFQIDSRGVVSLPTINDDEPELSNRARLAEHVATRSKLAAAQALLRQRALGEGTAVAIASRSSGARSAAGDADSNADSNADSAADSNADSAADSNAEPNAELNQEPRAKPDDLGEWRGQAPDPRGAELRKMNQMNESGKKPAPRAKAATKVEQLDPEIYAQNAAPSQVYQNIVGQQRKQAAPPVPVPSASALSKLSRGQVTIVASALAWHAVALDAEPTLVAMREVSTPDGMLVQGLVVDRQELRRWLEERDSPTAGEVLLVARPPGAAAGDDVPLIAPWSLAAVVQPRALAAAAADAAGIERGFLWRFLAGALGALAAGAFLVWLMASAERLARERSQFAAAAAHELRTPLAGLQLYGDMLADGLGDPKKARDYARRLSEEAARLGRVVANVLGFSQLERGNLALSPTEGDLAAVLRELVSRTEPTLERAGAFLELVVPAALPARFDRDAVLRIVGNLLDNAEKYGRGAHDRTITLAAVALPGQEAVELVVTDRGPGIPGELARRLFRPFSRAAGDDHPAGLGLGLALSHSLAEAMGGSLRYRRREGDTDFVLRLPAP